MAKTFVPLVFLVVFFMCCGGFFCGGPSKSSATSEPRATLDAPETYESAPVPEPSTPQLPSAANNFNAPDGYLFHDDRDRQRQAYLEEQKRLLDRTPIGATARCQDGTYSFSRSRRGACSSHGGVAIWYR